MRKSLGYYKNGNYFVQMFDDGTKIKVLPDEESEFIPAFPESMDIKITNCCDLMCPYCHEASILNGKHGNLNLHFFDTLYPWTECAIGGGNPLTHPDLIPFLAKLKNKNVITNITINEQHLLKQYNLVKELIEKELVRGVGVSYTGKLMNNDELITKVRQFSNVVLHVINGVITVERLRKIAGKGLKVLILGYKDFRRGVVFHDTMVDYNAQRLYNKMSEILKTGWFKIVSFDNLGLEQLGVKRLVTPDEWKLHYQGGDGSHTFYIDCVNEEFGISSTANERFPVKDSVDEMFSIIRKREV